MLLRNPLFQGYVTEHSRLQLLIVSAHSLLLTLCRGVFQQVPKDLKTKRGAYLTTANGWFLHINLWLSKPYSATKFNIHDIVLGGHRGVLPKTWSNQNWIVR